MIRVKFSESQEVSLLLPILFLPREATPGETYFSANVYQREFRGQKYVFM